MFLHQFTYRLRTYFRNGSILFWNAAFPLILMTIFGIVLLPLGNEEGADLNLPVAIVSNDHWEENGPLQEAIREISADSAAGHGGLLEVTLTDREDAEQLLERGTVDGIIIPDADNLLTLRVMNDGLSQSIIYSFTNQFTQMSSSVTELMTAHPERISQVAGAFESYDSDLFFERDAWADRGNPFASYFFALMGMVVLYGMTFAIFELNQILGNQSPQGARLHVSPAKRGTILSAGILVCFIFQYAINWIMILYMDLFLGVNLLEYGWQLALLMFAATLCSIGFGMIIGITVKARADTKISMAIGISMLMSFLAGMMTPNVRYTMIRNVPFLARLNPAELMTDSLFSIYFFDNTAQLLANCLQFIIYAIILFIVSGLLLRRQSYESV